MSYANAIRDIAPGSLWQDAAGALARVIAAAGSCVVISYSTGAREALPEGAFRARFSAPYERERVRSQFTMSLNNLGEFRAYWLPDMARIMVRSVSCRRQFRVPEGALLIGTFAAPCGVDAFFEALDAVIVARAASPGVMEARA